jgi:DNA-binding SARP family transcriptional activator
VTRCVSTLGNADAHTTSDGHSPRVQTCPRCGCVSPATARERTAFEARWADRHSLSVLENFDLVVGGIPQVLGDTGTSLVSLLGVVGQSSRERVQSALWPDCSNELASGRLRSLLYRLKRQTGVEVVQSIGTHSLRLWPELDIDLSRAAALTQMIGTDSRVPDLDGSAVIDILGRELLPLQHAEWLSPYQSAWSRNRLRALATFAHECARCSDWANATAAAEQVLVSEPFNEPVHYLLIAALLRDGLVTSARRLYDELSARLDRELGCTPLRSYRELARSVRR